MGEFVIVEGQDPFELAEEFQMNLLEYQDGYLLHACGVGASTVLAHLREAFYEDNAKFAVMCSVAYGRPPQERMPRLTLLSGIKEFFNIEIAGTLKTFSYLSAIEPRVSALCASFVEVELTPYDADLSKEDIVHVPIMAVQQKQRIA